MTYLPRRSRFVHGSTTWETELPARPWIPVDSTVGGRIVSAAGVPASYVVRRDRLIDLTLRIMEGEYPQLRSLIAFGQTRATFEWWPDVVESSEPFVVYLESPLAGEQWQPTRMGGFERGMEMTITLRGAALTNPWGPYFEAAGVSAVPVFGDPAVVPGPLPDPPESAPPGEEPEGLLFFDDFGGGVKSGPQNGVYWGETIGGGPTDDIAVVVDPGSASGYALGFTYGGNPDLTDDVRLEQFMRFPDLTEIWIEGLWKIPANYFHRDAAGPDNNKQLRLWDASYQDSIVHCGWSTLPLPDGRSVVLVEFSDNTGGGNHGTGPWTAIFAPGGEYRIGYGVKCASALGVPDGRIVMRVNGVKIYDRSNLALRTASSYPGAINAIRNGFLPGWSNSGFTETTTVLLRELSVADTIPADL